MKAGWAREVLEPSFLRGLERLAFARRRLPGESAGESRGYLQRTGGLDWVGHRPYEPGDDLRYLDHHVWSRIGKPYVRCFRSERSQRVDILLDVSRSMYLGRPAKSDVAKALAFVFAYIANAAGERAGTVPFADGLRGGYQAGKGSRGMARMIAYLDDVDVGGKTAIAGSMKTFVDGAREIGRAVFLSDFLDEGYGAGLEYLVSRGFEVMAVRLRASCDQEPEVPGGASMVIDIETGNRRQVAFTGSVLEEYRCRREEELEKTETLCRRMNVPFVNLAVEKRLQDLVFGDLRDNGFLE
jgi:uncharacterized protein (DUF58 family)